MTSTIDKTCENAEQVENIFSKIVKEELSVTPVRVEGRNNIRYPDFYNPILHFDIPAGIIGTKTKVDIPLGIASPDNGVYFAIINEKLQEPVTTPEDLGYKAAEIHGKNRSIDGWSL